MRKFNLFILSVLVLFISCDDIQTGDNYDIIVYGGTSAGVIAAYSASMEGKSVLLIEPGVHLGGLSSGGLGQTDIGNKHAVTGLSRDFYRRLGDHYGKLEVWKFEPSVAEKVFNDFIKESGVVVLYDHRLKGVEMWENSIQTITVEKSSDPDGDVQNFSARYFIDCSYEGDLMAMAGVSYTIGRESNEQYGETYNGVQMREHHQFPDGIDPYKIPGDPSGGRCWGIQDTGLDPRGTGDSLVQAYNYRLCLTQEEGNRISFEKPENYDPSHYELLARVIEHKQENKQDQSIRNYLTISPMPNGKTDINNQGPFSTDAIGMNYAYPEGSYEARDSIALAVENYIRGLLYFLSHNKRVTDEIRAQMSSWGWAADEFTDNDHFPHQMYVREARRMIGEYVMTEHNCLGDSMVEDGIGLAAYTMDSHNCQRVVVDGMVKNEGDVQIGGFPPYEISYRSLTPKREECNNLLVPVCLSASHIAFGSIRMEPVFMVLGQVSGVASAMALDEKKAVQEVDATQIMEKIESDPLLNGTSPDIVVDNSDKENIEVQGNWQLRELWMGQYKADHLAHSSGDEDAWVRFNPELPEENKKYHAFLYIPRRPWSGNEDAAEYSANVAVEVAVEGDVHTREYNFRKHSFDWVDLGEWSFSKGDYVRILAAGNEGMVLADALLLVPEEKARQ